MKRFCGVALIVAMCISFSACKPSGVSDEHYKYGMAALEVVDQYINYELTADEANEKLEEINSRENDLPDVDAEGYPLDENIERAVGTLADCFYLLSEGYDRYDDIKEWRNWLAEDLGEKKIKENETKENGTVKTDIDNESVIPENVSVEEKIVYILDSYFDDEISARIAYDSVKEIESDNVWVDIIKEALILADTDYFRTNIGVGLKEKYPGLIMGLKHFRNMEAEKYNISPITTGMEDMSAEKIDETVKQSGFNTMVASAVSYDYCAYGILFMDVIDGFLNSDLNYELNIISTSTNLSSLEVYWGSSLPDPKSESETILKDMVSDYVGSFKTFKENLYLIDENTFASIEDTLRDGKSTIEDLIYKQ